MTQLPVVLEPPATERDRLATRPPGVAAVPLLLHGAWIPEAAGGRFLLWAQERVRSERNGRRRQGEHPHLAPQHSLDALVRPLGAAPAQLGAAELLLPACDGVPSHPEGAPGRASLGRWKVRGAALDPREALPFLSRLPEGGLGGMEPHAAGADLAFWSRAAKLALELLARQRFFPTLTPQAHARWKAVLDDPGDAARLRALALAMPPACRALPDAPEPRALLEGFLHALIDAAIRSWMADESAGGPTDHGDPVERWLAALVAPEPAVQASAAERRVLATEVESWLAAIRSPGEGASIRLCLRLEPPENGQAAGGVRVPCAAARDWLLRYLLQPAEDPSLLVDAEQVWKPNGLPPDFARAEERLLADLGRVSRLWTPIERSLQDAAPARLALNVGEAYAFLREAAPLLEECGYGIFVPGWWTRSGGGPSASVRLRVRPKGAGGAAGRGLLGLESLVEFDWQAAVGDAALSRAEFERLARLKVPLVRIRGQWVEIRPDDVHRALALWDSQGPLTLGEALQRIADPEGGLPVAAVEAEGWLGEFLAGRESQRLADVAVADDFSGELRPYQRRGLSWLSFMGRFRLGACLADDMGLGKTVQVVARLLAADAGRPHLVVCPTSVVVNWQRELARFGPRLRAYVHHGPERRRGADLAADVDRTDVVVTTYPLALRDSEELARIAWHSVILDEAQNIKNPEAKQSRAVRGLRADVRLALTGTPVENRLSDLWAIFDFLNPGLLGSLKGFRQRWAVPIERYQDPARAAALQTLVRPFLLRRVKTDPTVVPDLPEKIETKEFCALTREQATLYQAVVDEMMQRVQEAEGIERKGRILAALTKLKQVCNHPAQFLKDGSALGDRSAKLRRLGELLEEALAEGDRALVFTQFAQMGRLLQEYLQRHTGRGVLFLHGGLARTARQALIDRFQSDGGEPIFVLSLKAGGLGLNLTRANHVFHFDRWWNPAVEDQATDRAFRIGQKQNVIVHKFVCRGTLEEKIDALIESKKDLARRIVGTGEAWLTELSTDELRRLVTLESTALEE